MAGDGTSFQIDIPVDSASVEPAAAAVARLAQELTDSQSAAAQAAQAMRDGQAAYAAAEVTADKAAKAVEKIGVMADAQRGKLQAAMDAGDASGAERAAAKLANLVARQAEAAAVADKAKAAVVAEAAALDQLTSSAASAATAQAKNVAALATAKKKADEAAKAAAAAAGTGKTTDTLEGIAKLSGPLGGTVMKAKDLAEGFGKLKSSLGAAGPYAAVAAAFVAIAVGLGAVTVAAVAGIGKITAWAINLSDKEGLIKKQTERLDKGFKSLFSGLKITKFTDNFERVVDLFDESNAAGRAIKVVFESLFQPIVDGVAAFLPKVRTAFIQFEIMALKALIAIKPYGSTIMAVVKVLGVMAAIVTGVVIVAIAAIAANLAIMAVGIGIVISAVTAFVAGVVWLSLKIQELSASVMSGIVGAFTAASAWLSALDLSKVGGDILQGLINGILGAGPAVLKALTGVVNGAIGAAKAALGIASPSKVFAEIGEQTAAGMSGGVEAGSSDVQGSLENMVAPPEVSAGAPAASATGGGAVYNITIQGGDTAKANLDAFTEWLESVGAQAGTAVPVG